jgi:hypothetical protein
MINDPRVYTLDYPKSNIIISQALDIVAGKLDISELIATISKFLKNGNDALINVALNLAPNAHICQTIWQALNLAINNYDGKLGNDEQTSQMTNQQDVTARVFAIPIVLVAGSKSKAKLKGGLDTEKLNQFFNTKQIFSDKVDNFIAGKLVDPKTIAQIKPSQYYYWLRNLNNAKLWLPISIDTTSIEVQNEGVFLRFLIGVTIGKELAINQEAFRQASMDLMQLISEELKNEQVTLFPIPFAPVNLSEAFTVGDKYRKEIAIQVAISNIVRKIREQQQEPIVDISTESESIKIIITCGQDPELSETSLWHLNRFDDFNEIVTKITDLLHDMNIKLVENE